MSQPSQRSWGRFAGSLLALVAVFAGIPAFLISCARLALGSSHPVPGVGSVDEIRTWIDRELSTSEMIPILLRTLLIVGWILWAVLAMSVISAVITSRPRFNHWSLPSVGMFDNFAGWIAAGLTVFASFAPSVTAYADSTSGPPVPSSVYATLVVDNPHVGAVSDVADVVPAGYTRVLSGESIQKVAQRTLGDPERWGELWELRDDQRDNGTGTAWTQPWRIEADWLLKVPTAVAGGGPVAHLGALPAPTESVAAAGTVTVRPGGSYWQIATEQLSGDADTSSNGDIAALTRALRAHNAPRLGYADPNLLHPGDLVELVDVPTTPLEAPTADAEGAVIVASGSSYWQIATDHLTAETGETPNPAATAALADELIAFNAPLLGYNDPTLLHPGDVVYTALHTAATDTAPPDDPAGAPAEVTEVPADAPAPVDEAAVDTATPSTDLAAEPREAPVPPVATATPVATPAQVSPPQSLPAPSASDVRETGTAPAPLPVDEPEEGLPVAVLSGLTALAAAGLGLRLAVRRSKAKRRCRPGERPAPVPAGIAPELAAVAYRDVSDVTWMSMELRWLAHHLTADARADMVVQLVQLNADRSLEVAFTQVPPIAPPAGWAVAADRVWILPTAHDPAELEALAEAPPVLPALVTLGDAVDGGQVYLNTEAAAGLNVTGDAEQVTNWVRNAVWEITGAALAERPLVRVVASDVASEFAGSTDVAVVDASALFDELSEVFADGDVQLHQSMLSLRTNEWEAWPPTVVIAGAMSDHDVDRWESVAGTPWVACFSTSAALRRGLEVHIADGAISLPAIGLTLPAAQLTTVEAETLVEALEAVDADPVDDVELVIAEPTPANHDGTNEPLTLSFGADDWEAPQWPVMVNVLGEPNVTIHGEIAKILPQQLAILALLAIKREVSIEDLKRAIWLPKKVDKIDPDTGKTIRLPSGEPQMVEVEVTKHRVRDALSELRKAVGGTRVLSNVNDGKVAAGPDLGCDTLLFEALNARARQDPASRTVRLHEMLLLVRGPVFGYAPSSSPYWRWVDLSHLQAVWEGRVITAAHTLSGMYLEAGDASGARHIAERGLAADPLNSALTERLMEAYAQLGSIDSAQRVYEAHDRAMIDFGGATPETRMVLDRIRAGVQHLADDHIAQASAS